VDRRRRTLAALLAVVALLLAAVLGVVLLLTSLGRDDTGTPGAAGRSTSAAAPAPASIPTGYTRYDADGFSLGVPAGWKPEPVRPGVVDIREPNSSRFLRLITVGSTASALDQLTAAERQFGANPDYAPYRRIRLEKVSYRSYDAAEWEFTFTSRNSLRHVLYRGVVVGGRSYGLYLSVPDGRWAESQAAFRTAADTFRPAGG